MQRGSFLFPLFFLFCCGLKLNYSLGSQGGYRYPRLALLTRVGTGAAAGVPPTAPGRGLACAAGPRSVRTLRSVFTRAPWSGGLPVSFGTR